ncbi:ORF98 [Ranid herpesvirus 1]|uniref:ORF98 n=1 Tax=Ranid herpesvirus 1 TaxID=85655 RepID=Q14VN2_9VIRU|nr:ORF98 [Ranid herpesvirus 1]ABG25774.1 ORF98 [Ranid herpesvirus 1]
MEYLGPYMCPWESLRKQQEFLQREATAATKLRQDDCVPDHHNFSRLCARVLATTKPKSNHPPNHHCARVTALTACLYRVTAASSPLNFHAEVEVGSITGLIMLVTAIGPSNAFQPLLVRVIGDTARHAASTYPNVPPALWWSVRTLMLLYAFMHYAERDSRCACIYYTAVMLTCSLHAARYGSCLPISQLTQLLYTSNRLLGEAETRRALGRVSCNGLRRNLQPYMRPFPRVWTQYSSEIGSRAGSEDSGYEADSDTSDGRNAGAPHRNMFRALFAL